MLLNFVPDAPYWFLLRCVSCDWDSSVDVRLRARSSLLRLGAGLEQHFCLKLSQPPASLIVALPDVPATQAHKDQVMDKFMATPSDCLPLGARRLAERCRNAEDPLEVIVEPIDFLSRNAPLASDFSERAHAQMRQNLRSSTVGRRFDTAADNVLCRQCRTAHMQRNGRDPALVPISWSGQESQDPDDPSPSGSGSAGALVVSESGGRSKRRVGNLLLRDCNHKKARHKQVYAATRSLSTPELERIHAHACAEWAMLNDDMKESWRIFFENAPGKKSRGADAVVVAERPKKQFAPLWGQRGTDASYAICPSTLAAHRRLDRNTLHPVAPVQSELIVSRAAPVCPVVPTHVAGWAGLVGCGCSMKNMCRAHGLLDRQEVSQLDHVTKKLCKWVAKLGKAVVDEVDSFLWLHDASSLAPRCDRIVLLADAKYQPQ